MLAQRVAAVFVAKEAAAAQFGQHQVDEFGQPAGEPRGHDVEAVRAAFLEPLLQLVCNARGRADYLLMPPRPGDAQIKLADTQFVAPREVGG